MKCYRRIQKYIPLQYERKIFEDDLLRETNGF